MAARRENVTPGDNQVHQLTPLAQALSIAAGASLPWPAQAEEAEVQRVEIVATSPLPGQGIDRAVLPYMTQVLRRSAIDTAQLETTTDLLARHAAGTAASDVQGSPHQADFSFRGQRASGLLGAPQGLSVYLDGVRINEPFGDVVNWDLVPEFALDSVALVPGANPAFGLNTLGGAVALTTLDGRSAPGWQVEARAGSFGRHQLSVAHGHAGDDWQHYIGAGLFGEDGWRDHSAGRLGTLLAKAGVQTDAGDWGLNLLAARSRLVGNGLVPWETLDEDGQRSPDLGRLDRSAVYTHPDRTDQRLTQLSATWRLALDASSSLDALAYTRRTWRDGANGDQADDEGETAPASFNRSATRQRGHGTALGYSTRQGPHRWQAGLSWDASRVRYRQSEQAATFGADRGVQPLPGEEAEFSAAVEGTASTLGAYASDTWQLAAGSHLTTTLRYNEARLANTLTRAGEEDEDEPIELPRERFTYRSWNPAIGLAQRLGEGQGTVFANLARNTRVPTVIELGCADPAHPCRLPAGLQSDPYLKPVRSTTLEAGWRTGSDRDGASFSAYRIDNRDDIVFSSVSANGELGYFRNVAATRHQGLDVDWRGRRGAWQWAVGYSHLDATYQADATLRQGDRNVRIVKGAPIAGLPRHSGRMSLDWSSGPWSAGADWQAVSRRTTAGNEDGLIEDDSAERVDLSIPGYALLHLRGGWKPLPGLEIFARVGNALDRRFASYGALGATRFDATGRYTGEDRDALFVGPGAPRSISIGLSWRG
jgi:outer membrane receptor protein involved in Fe transport